MVGGQTHQSKMVSVLEDMNNDYTIKISSGCRNGNPNFPDAISLESEDNWQSLYKVLNTPVLSSRTLTITFRL